MECFRTTRNRKYILLNGVRIVSNNENPKLISLESQVRRRQQRTPEEREAARIEREARAAKRVAVAPMVARPRMIDAAVMANMEQYDEAQIVVPRPTPVINIREHGGQMNVVVKNEHFPPTGLLQSTMICETATQSSSMDNFQNMSDELSFRSHKEETCGNCIEKKNRARLGESLDVVDPSFITGTSANNISEPLQLSSRTDRMLNDILDHILAEEN